jgi:hypothetical protein
MALDHWIPKVQARTAGSLPLVLVKKQSKFEHEGASERLGLERSVLPAIETVLPSRLVLDPSHEPGRLMLATAAADARSAAS